MISFEKLNIFRGEKQVIEDLTLMIKTDEISSLIGPSGCGKTSILLTLLGVIPPSSGAISFKKQVLAGPDVFVPIEKRPFGVVFQDLALFSHLNIKNNIAYGLDTHDKKSKEDIVEKMLELFKIKHLKNKYPRDLSAGERQRVALARAMAPSPSYLLLDETFASIDPLLRKSLRVEIRSILKKQGLGCLLISHDIEEVMSFSDQIIILNSQGKLQQEGAPAKIQQGPSNDFVKKFLES